MTSQPAAGDRRAGLLLLLPPPPLLLPSWPASTFTQLSSVLLALTFFRFVVVFLFVVFFFFVVFAFFLATVDFFFEPLPMGLPFLPFLPFPFPFPFALGGSSGNPASC